MLDPTLKSKIRNSTFEGAYSNSNSRASGFHDRVQTVGEDIQRDNGKRYARPTKQAAPKTMSPPTPNRKNRKGRHADIRLPKVRMTDDKEGKIT